MVFPGGSKDQSRHHGFSLGETVPPGIWGTESPPAESRGEASRSWSSCRCCLQILTAVVITIWKFPHGTSCFKSKSNLLLLASLLPWSATKNMNELTDTPVWTGTEHCDQRHKMASAVCAESCRSVLNQSLWVRPPDSSSLHDAAYFTRLPTTTAFQPPKTIDIFNNR